MDGKMQPCPDILQKQLKLPGQLMRINTYGDGSCLCHAICLNINLEHQHEKQPGVLLREIMAQFCLPLRNMNMRALKTSIQSLQSMLQHKMHGLRHSFNTMNRNRSNPDSTMWDMIWSSLGSPPTVPSSSKAYEHIHLDESEQKKEADWLNIFDIVFASRLLGYNIVFLNHSPECYQRCTEKKCDTRCVDPGLYCGVSNYDQNRTMIINWVGNSHFEATGLQKEDDSIQTMFDYGSPVAVRLMTILNQCDVQNSDRIQ